VHYDLFHRLGFDDVNRNCAHPNDAVGCASDQVSALVQSSRGPHDDEVGIDLPRRVDDTPVWDRVFDVHLDRKRRSLHAFASFVECFLPCAFDRLPDGFDVVDLVIATPKPDIDYVRQVDDRIVRWAKSIPWCSATSALLLPSIGTRISSYICIDTTASWKILSQWSYPVRADRSEGIFKAGSE